MTKKTNGQTPESLTGGTTPPLSDAHDIYDELSDLYATSTNQSLNEAREGDFEALPIDGFSLHVQKAIKTAAEFLDVHRDKATAAALAAVAAAVGHNARIIAGPYTNFAQVWLAIVDKQGSNKSAVISHFFKPLEKLDKEAFERYRRERNEYERQLKAKDPTARKPERRRFLTNDTTQEALIRNVAANPVGTCLCVDELKALFLNMGRYTGGKSSEIEMYLSMWSNQPYHTSRMAEEKEVFDDEPVLNIIGGIQPKVLRKLFTTFAESENGFLTRWLYVCPPFHSLSTQTKGKREFQETAATWKGLIDTLTRTTTGTAFELGEGAADVFHDFKREYINYYNANPEDESFELAYMSKNPQNVLRLALITHLMNENPAHLISGEEMEFSVRLMKQFNKYALKCWDIITDSQSKTQTAADVLRIIYQYVKRQGKPVNELNQTELAKMLGTSQQSVSKIKKQIFPED